MNELTGKHALVTGGGTGIGLAIATSLAGAGADVTITGRRIEVLEDAAKAHPNLHPGVMDVSDEADVKSAVAKARRRVGRSPSASRTRGLPRGASLPRPRPRCGAR